MKHTTPTMLSGLTVLFQEEGKYKQNEGTFGKSDMTELSVCQNIEHRIQCPNDDAVERNVSYLTNIDKTAPSIQGS